MTMTDPKAGIEKAATIAATRYLLLAIVGSFNHSPPPQPIARFEARRQRVDEGSRRRRQAGSLTAQAAASADVSRSIQARFASSRATSRTAIAPTSRPLPRAASA